jgi:outer membrane biosynthesis protein TonB
MDRAQATGFGVSAAGHVALLVILSVALARAAIPPPPSDAIEVSFVDKVGLTSAAPDPSPTPPEQGRAPDLGPVEDAAPAAPAPAPQPAPPAPRQADVAPTPERARPQPAETRPSPPRTAPARQQEGSEGTGQRTRRSLIGPDLLRGIGRDPSPSRNNRQQAATMSAQAMADIAAAIARQVQPCADRQVNPGPGAERIRTAINLRLNRDGSLAAPPRVIGQTGIDDENRRYAARVADLAIATFVGCAPLRGLPQELYDVPRGWSNFTMNYSLPG